MQVEDGLAGPDIAAAGKRDMLERCGALNAENATAIARVLEHSVAFLQPSVQPEHTATEQCARLQLMGELLWGKEHDSTPIRKSIHPRRCPQPGRGGEVPGSLS